MGILGRFLQDERGDMVRGALIVSVVAATASIAGAHFLDKSLPAAGSRQVARSVPSAEFLHVAASLPRPTERGAESLRQVTVDYTPTGSIPANLAHPIVLDPCTGAEK